MPVDAAQVAAPQRDAVAIEEFQDLDRDLAAVVEPVAKLRGGELARLGVASRTSVMISTISATVSRRKK